MGSRSPFQSHSQDSVVHDCHQDKIPGSEMREMDQWLGCDCGAQESQHGPSAPLHRSVGGTAL